MRGILMLVCFLLFAFALAAQPVKAGKVRKPKKVKEKKEQIELLPGLANLKPKKALAMANELYELGDKAGSHHYYKAVLSSRSKRKDVQYRVGETALYLRDYQTAHKYSSALIPKEKKFPKVRYFDGLALKHLGQYDKAMNELNLYMLTYSLSDEDSTEVSQLIEGCVIGSNSRPDRSVKLYRLNPDINTPSSENGASLAGNSLIFTHIGDGGSIIRKALNPESRSSEIDDFKGNVNRRGYQTSDPFLAEDGKTLLFTRCAVSQSGNLSCAIYLGELQADGKVTGVQKLSKGINQPGFLSLQPALTKNEYGREILYFVSNRPGGYGGFDIWYSIRLNDGRFTRAYNVGTKINSKYNETTPFYTQMQESLYYSSDHPTGFGGFDIYRIQGLQRYWESAANLGNPINSSVDDYFFRLTGDNTGYFSSNRSGADSKDHENCCDDIFKFEKQ